MIPERRNLSRADQIKSKIAELTGFPDPTIVSLQNRIATRHPFQDEAIKLYELVDKIVEIAQEKGFLEPDSKNNETANTK